MSYTNDDGLVYRFGTDQAKVARTGSPSTYDVEGTVVVDLDAEALPAVADGSVFVNELPSVAIPAGALLRSATVITTTGFTSGGAATLDIGLAERDGTAIDADGIDAAIALTAIDTVGEEVACDGALIATKLAKDSYVTVNVGTAAYTAGRAKLLIKFIIPDA